MAQSIFPEHINIVELIGSSLIPRLIKGKGSESGNKTNLVHASKHIKKSKVTDR